MKLFEDIYITNLNAVCNMGGLYLCSDDEWEYPGGTFRQNKFYYILDGECVITVEGHEYRGKAGSWFFIPANAYHSFYNIKGSGFKKYWMHFDAYPDNNIFNRLGLSHVVEVEDGKRIEELFKKYSEISNSKKLSDILYAKAYLTELLAEYIKISDGRDAVVTSVGDERFSDLLRYINENKTRSFTNAELAALLYIHPNHLIRLFKEKTGKTPSRYIAERKMEYARRLIETTGLSVSEISETVGISDSAYFSRLFKSCYGMSPTYCRKYFLKSWYTDDI